jgi:uroporphyrin-III C-methyltransferase
LGELQDTIVREHLASPSVIVVGDVMSGLLAAAQADTTTGASAGAQRAH